MKGFLIRGNGRVDKFNQYPRHNTSKPIYMKKDTYQGCIQNGPKRIASYGIRSMVTVVEFHSEAGEIQYVFAPQ